MTLLARGNISVRLSDEIERVRDVVLQEINLSWLEQVSRRPMHDGQLVSVRSWRSVTGGAEVCATLIPYRWWIAQRHRAIDLHVQPLAICGLSMDPDGRVLIGRRAQMLDYPGRWELVPSGGCEVLSDGTVNPMTDAIRELEEESGLTALSAQMLGLTLDPSNGVFEVALLLRVATATPRVNYEHDELLFVEPDLIGQYDLVPPGADLLLTYLSEHESADKR
jgi:8-oxo-dGTP pyrophosphatase MutT (NUDIX family)